MRNANPLPKTRAWIFLRRRQLALLAQAAAQARDFALQLTSFLARRRG